MSDTREAYDTLREFRQSRKSERYAATIALLDERGIGYQIGKSRNIIVAGRYELWPSTHAWFDRKDGKRGRGIHGFLKVIGLSEQCSDCNRVEFKPSNKTTHCIMQSERVYRQTKACKYFEPREDRDAEVHGTDIDVGSNAGLPRAVRGISGGSAEERRTEEGTEQIP